MPSNLYSSTSCEIKIFVNKSDDFWQSVWGKTIVVLALQSKIANGLISIPTTFKPLSIPSTNIVPDPTNGSNNQILFVPISSRYTSNISRCILGTIIAGYVQNPWTKSLSLLFLPR